jgi:glycosyltransferase involved in cell wall biosynthesis
VTGPRIGVDALALRTGGGVTWLVRLVPALARIWPEASIEVLVRRGVTVPPDGDARVTWTRRRVPRGALRLLVEGFVVRRWVRRSRLDVVLVGADAGPARLPCPFVQASLNAKPYTASGWRYRWLRRAARATARGADATAFLSESLRRVAEPILSPRRSVVISAGVDLPPTSVAPRPIEEPYVLVVATGYAHKDLGTALRAVSKLRGRGRRERLAWVGLPVDPGVVADLRRLAKDDPDVLLEVGPVDGPTLERWYAHAAAVMLPSLEESGGLPVAEALARGLPVVASDIPAIAETAAGAARLHPPGDAARAASLLEEALAQPVEPGERTRAGGAWAASRTWDAAARLYRDVLEQAMASRRDRPA